MVFQIFSCCAVQTCSDKSTSLFSSPERAHHVCHGRATRARVRIKPRFVAGRLHQLAPHRVASLGYPRPSVKARVNLKEDLESVDPGETKDALLNGDAGEKFQVAVGIGGLVASGIMTWSLVTLKDTGCGLPPGPGGVLGALEGVSYLYVVGLIAWSAITKAKTGSGLPAGPGHPRRGGGYRIPGRPRRCRRRRHAGDTFRIYPKRHPRRADPASPRKCSGKC